MNVPIHFFFFFSISLLQPKEGNWPWVPPSEGGGGDPRFRFSLTSLAHPTRRCIGFARRRVGRGGRYVHELTLLLKYFFFLPAIIYLLSII